METTSRCVYRVFVVDDEAIIASTLAAILKMSGFDAKPFVHAQEALLAAKEETPDLLISDVMMPEISGVELAIEMKGLHPGCKVLLFSGQAATADLLLVARSQGHDFELLSKPIHPAKLLLRLETIMRAIEAHE